MVQLDVDTDEEVEVEQEEEEQVEVEQEEEEQVEVEQEEEVQVEGVEEDDDLELCLDEKHNEDDVVGDPEEPERRYPSRVRELTGRAMERMVTTDTYTHNYSETPEEGRNNVVMSMLGDDPKTQKQAYASEARDEWVNAEIEEVSSLLFHKVGTLVERAPDMNVMGSRFIYKSKRRATGEIYRRKVRFVCKGFQQQEGIDFNETFSSQVRYPSIRLLLFLVNFYYMHLFSFDIKTFFLYGKIKEMVYM